METNTNQHTNEDQHATPSSNGASTSLFDKVQHFLVELTDLRPGMDHRDTVEEIRNNKRMQGANAWLLMCSIVIASLGLDLNSPAIIIGGMLISPLMSPILGIGLAVGINDKKTLTISLQHFGIAMAIAIVTSTLYFLLSPFGEVNSEIAARTKPTLLDVFVAFFGGIAGIISTSRKSISNALPGVAIATALMPPLCVTGFGLAKGNWPVMFNSFYLFFLNATFVSIATYSIVRLLKFPYHEYQNRKERNKTRLLLVLFTLIMIVPSTIILVDVLTEVRQKQTIEEFVTNNFNESPKYTGWELVQNDSTSKLVVSLIGPSVNEQARQGYEEELKAKLDQPIVLRIIQDDDVGLEDIKKLKSEISGIQEINRQLELAKQEKEEKESRLEDIAMELDSIVGDTIPFARISEQMRIHYPSLESFAFARMQTTDYKQWKTNVPTILVHWKSGLRTSTMNKYEERIRQDLLMELPLDTLYIIRY